MPKALKGEQFTAAIIKVLREERIRQNLSMNILSQLSGLSQSSLSLLESGRRKPTLDTLIRLSDALSVQLWKIIKCASENK